ncbi:MAG: Holliday junction resolvase RuvX [Beijerinckiaceae bacterium]|jgi:putative Holliday junction resolvase|nr:Holliday junction resolvase RuvX [Beijerinckiaceae bacterium]
MKPGGAEALTIEALAALPGTGKRLLGLDLGEKTVGLALSDVERRIATAFRTLPRRKFREDWVELSGIITQHRVAALVLGLPLNMDGSSGPRVQATRTYASNIRQVSPIPILFWDERLSTVAAERALLSVDLSRAKRAAIIDATAAAFILQGVLDRLRHEIRRAEQEKGEA